MLMQDGFRLSKDEISRMVQYVADGGVFDKCDRPIAIVDFDDGFKYIRDGLHRIAAIFIARKDRMVYPDEYVLEPMSYQDYIYPNIQNGWYTPHDPRKEVRVPDLCSFKKSVISLLKSGYDEDEVASFINSNRGQYIKKRMPYKHNSIEFFANLFGGLICHQ